MYIQVILKLNQEEKWLSNKSLISWKIWTVCVQFRRCQIGMQFWWEKQMMSEEFINYFYQKNSWLCHHWLSEILNESIVHPLKEWTGKTIYLNFSSIFGDFFLKFFEEEVSDYLSWPDSYVLYVCAHNYAQNFHQGDCMQSSSKVVDSKFSI